VAIVNALQLEATRHCTSYSGLFLAEFLLPMHPLNCYFPASNQTSNITIRFSDPDLLKESSNLAIRQRFYFVTLSFDQLI